MRNIVTGGRMAALLVATSLVGCGVPIPPELPDTSAPRGPATGEVDRLVPEDTRVEALATAVRLLADRIEQARAALHESPDRQEEDAIGVLLGVPGGGSAPGVLPAIDPDRAGTASDDLVTALITLASDAGGEPGRIVLEVIRDPMLGDLGAWQRDPVGILAALRTTAADADATRSPAALDTEILALPGELTRALGYAFVLTAADESVDSTVIDHARTQAAGRLGVVLIALELAAERLAPS